jgi:hypothetical protein
MKMISKEQTIKSIELLVKPELKDVRKNREDIDNIENKL